ncbi:MAG TPA: PRC-barrel domain-containing protein [Verrucomicrobiae bacterium]
MNILATAQASSVRPTRPLQSLRHLEGFKIIATDGEIGKVHDFFFDDDSWLVRYLVVDIGHWLPRRKLLLPAVVLRPLDAEGGSLSVSLTRARVCASPGVDTDMPVSRRRELEMHMHYDWPFHWGGVDGWVGPVPPIEPIEPPQPPPGSDDAGNVHLRSVREMIGYQVESADGPVGTLHDFLADDNTWAIRHFIVNTGRWFPHRQVAISPGSVAGTISWSEKRFTLHAKREDLVNLRDLASKS